MNEPTPAPIQRLIEAMPLPQRVSVRKAADVLGCTESDVLDIVSDGDLFSWTHSPAIGKQGEYTDYRTGEVTLLPRITPDADPSAISVDGEGLLWIACVRFEQLLSGQDLPPKDVVEARLASVIELARKRALRPPNPTSQGQPAPAAESAESPQAWQVFKPQRFGGYAAPLYALLNAAWVAGNPCPTARDVLEAWGTKQPAEVAKVLTDGIDYYDSNGDTKAANLAAIREAIARMTRARQAHRRRGKSTPSTTT